jgi:hypothetical protein
LSDNKPPLGKNPFEAEIAANTRASTTSTTVTVVSTPTPRDLDSAWFQKQARTAEIGIRKIEGLSGWMELRFVPETFTNTSARELLEAVQSSEIKTFGWPIGVTLQSRAEYRPKPTENGIKAEVSINESRITGRSSYDYWALTQNADFFLLQSLFEDTRSEKKIFFNTRIVRVAESFLFAANLYSHLGLPQQTRLHARVKHKGLKGRELSSSSRDRALFDKRVTDADESETTLTIDVGQIQPSIVELARGVCAPLFEKFDFMQFQDPIYEDIVRRFMEGVVT